MDVATAISFLVIGFVGGTLGALVGLAGATFIIPLATLVLAPDTQQLRAAAMAGNLCVALGALVPYARSGQVDWRVVRLVTPWAVATVALGVWLSVGIDTVLYRGLFGAFVLAVVAHELRNLLKPPAVPADERTLSPVAGAAVGSTAGLLAGVLSVGGGVVFMPILREWLGTPVKRAAATSMVMVLPTVVVGTAAQMWSMSTLTHPKDGTMLPGALLIAACLAPATLTGGWSGAHLNARLPKRAVQWAVVCALTCAGVLLMRPLIERVAMQGAP